MCRISALALVFATLAMPVVWAANPVMLPSPCGEGSGQTDLYSFSGKAYLTWIEAEDKHKGTLYFAVFSEGRWSPKQAIVRSDRMFINWADVPRILVQRDAITVTWLEMLGAGTYAYGVRVARSGDGGRTWDASWLHDDLSEKEHGFVSLVARGDGGFGALWLDGRAMSDEGHGHGGAGGHDGGGMQLRFRAFDNGVWGPEHLLDDRTCECCQTALTRSGDRLIAAFRDNSGKNIRDIALIASGGGDWPQPRVVHADQWQIHGCPVNGPALAAAGKTIALAWFTGSSADPGVFLTASTDGGEHFGPKLRVGESNAMGRVQTLAWDSEWVWVLWLAADGQFQVQGYSVGTAGKLLEAGSAQTVGTGGVGRASGFARMVRVGEQILFAFTDAQDSRVKTLLWTPVFL